MESGCCARCGRPLALIEETWAEDKSVKVHPRGELCPSCYLDILEQEHL